ncbi:DegT/DnrJ/EryC1/StrS family aminotransferase [Clostridium folliculivorans]|uniref:DegT/DnrJ/EryC1/StrS aminotransferase family protein n=1 Tax=Clostridium folliculivorans TaxID=2886038 RepID=A0A9W5Y5H6_9CLOT|nr:DegT/DnrJ/EryC1/StrS family aminotransferase [Clostridium folliculivorans]GKU26932.1 hypothetical protein CFOLD11_37590 [Clostridium folliculivorans]GKU31583.1 hypothetical protein CFB3_36900 [Clostridium folliculivorans]
MEYNAMKPIGGEFWFQLDEFNNKNKSETEGTLLSGGQSAIKFILDKINLEKDEVMLLPAYLCPSILQWFNKKRLNIVFYKINSDLSIDLDYLRMCVDKNKVKAIFFINYFGFYHNDDTLTQLEKFKNDGIILIEDAVQMLWKEPSKKFIGNFVFNSLRKFVPIDGSIVVGCSDKLKTEEVDDYLSLMYKARMSKTLYQCFGIGKEEEFLGIFNSAEECYYKREEYQLIDKQSLDLINRLDIEFIKDRRQENYIYLINELNNHGVKSLFQYSDGAIPVGLPILVNNRDVIRKELRRKNIYCPVHWDIRNEYWVKDFTDSYNIADKILTLPIDQRYDKVDMDRLIGELVGLIEQYKY